MDEKQTWRGRTVLVASGLCLALVGAACGSTPTNVVDPSGSAAPTPGQTQPIPSVPAAAKLMPMDWFPTDFPQDLAIAFDSVWTANEFVDTVTRVDPRSGEVMTIKVTPGLGPQNIEASPDAIWTGGGGGIDRIDPGTNAVTGHIDDSMDLVYAFGALWAAGQGNLVRINPESASIEETIESSDDSGREPGQSCGVSTAAGSLWLACGQTVDRVNPETGKVVGTLRPTGPDPAVTGAGTDLWLMTGHGPYQVASPDLASTSLDRLNPETNEVIPGTTVNLAQGAGAGRGLVDGDVIWFPTTFGEGPDAGMLYQFDATSGTVIAAFDVSEGKGYGSNSIAIGYGSLWAASGTANALRRFQMPPG